MQGQTHIDTATTYIRQRDEELARDRSRRHAMSQHRGPSPGMRERFGLSLIHLGARLMPKRAAVRVVTVRRA